MISIASKPAKVFGGLYTLIRKSWRSSSMTTHADTSRDVLAMGRMSAPRPALTYIHERGLDAPEVS